MARHLLLFALIVWSATAIVLNDDDDLEFAAAPRKPDGACSEERLRKLMHQGMAGTASDSKKGVASAISEAVGGSWAVICAECTFSYIAHATTYCVHARKGVTCLVYRDD